MKKKIGAHVASLREGGGGGSLLDEFRVTREKGRFLNQQTATCFHFKASGHQLIVAQKIIPRTH